MPQTETYDALQKGVVDGLVSPMEALKGWKFVEVTKCTTENYGIFVLDRLLRCHEQEEMGFPAQGRPGNHSKGEQGMDREDRRRPGTTWTRKHLELALSKGNQIIKLSPEEDARWAKAV